MQVEELTETRRIQRILFGPQWDFSTHNVNKDQYNRCEGEAARQQILLLANHLLLL